MLCPYCQTEQEQKKVCSFCGADLFQNRPKIKQTLSQEEAYQNQPILATYHTYDLLLLLKHLRADRTFMYKNMQIVKKAPEGAKRDDYEQINKDGQQMYRELTAQKNVIEQILTDRMGYYPKRIDNKLLGALQTKIETTQ